MQDVGKLYEEYSAPLKATEEFVEDKLYFDAEGNAWKYVGEGEFTFMYGSLLVASELIIGLTPKQLELFWKLHRNRDKFKLVH